MKQKVILIRGRFRLDKNVADTKLEKTSLSADVFIHPLLRTTFCSKLDKVNLFNIFTFIQWGYFSRVGVHWDV